MPSTRRALPFILLVLAAVLVAASPAAAASPADPNSWCGTHPLNLPIFAAQHQAYERQLARQRLAGSLPEKAAPVVFQSGNVAVIEDDGSIVRRLNLFDLAGRAMQILRRPKGITVVRSPLDVKDFTGDKLPLGDGRVSRTLAAGSVMSCRPLQALSMQHTSKCAGALATTIGFAYESPACSPFSRASLKRRRSVCSGATMSRRRGARSSRPRWFWAASTRLLSRPMRFMRAFRAVFIGPLLRLRRPPGVRRPLARAIAAR